MFFSPKASASILSFLAFLSVLALAACTSPSDDDSSGGGGSVADSSLNGIFLKIDGKSYALGSADVYRFSPTNQRQVTAKYTGTTKFHDNNVSTASVTVSKTLPVDSIQTCGLLNTNAAMTIEVGNNLDEWGGTFRATVCQVKINYLSQNGGIEGKVLSATLKNDSGKTITLSDAGFRVFHYSGYMGTAPAVTPTSDFMATLQIDSGSFELAAGQHFRLSKSIVVSSGTGFGTRTEDGNAQVDGNASDAITLRAQSIPSSAGSYACNQTFSGGKTNISVFAGTYLAEASWSAIPVGGSAAACSLKVDGQTNAAQIVTYSGTLVADDNILSLARRTIKVRGAYRNYSLGVALPAANESLQADSNGSSFQVGSDGASQYPASGKYKLATSGSAFRPSGTKSLSFGFRRGAGTRSDLSLGFRYVPDSVGTYACGAVVPGTSPSSGYRTVVTASLKDTAWSAVEFRGYGTSEAPGSSCSITVTSRGASRIEGTYTATLVAVGAKNMLPDGDTTLTVSGTFRLPGLP
ncbi:MAG TPA: hypothetical protein VHO02_02195 [Fibrobacteria bacterium]|nr:hypothetical protein [Fibrobacteria bacterium]